MPVDSDLRYSSEDLRRFTIPALEPVGTPAQDAASPRTKLIRASLWVWTHGISRVAAPRPPDAGERRVSASRCPRGASTDSASGPAT